MPYHAGPDQDFDVIWRGVAPSAVSLGHAPDRWIATGGKVSAAYDEVIDRHTHANYPWSRLAVFRLSGVVGASERQAPTCRTTGS